jgi:16S rRNA (cytosine967-C5)-methyltransferase
MEHSLKGKKTQYSPLGISFLNRPSINLSDLEEFKKGMFEVQDEASQLVSLQVDCLVVVLHSKRPHSN